MNYLDWFENSVMASCRSGWLDRDEFATDGQSKRFRAILRVWEKVSKRFLDENPFDTLPTVTFFAPSVDHAGRVMRTQPMGVVVYLAPTLESIRRVTLTTWWRTNSPMFPWDTTYWTTRR